MAAPYPLTFGRCRCVRNDLNLNVATLERRVATSLTCHARLRPSRREACRGATMHRVYGKVTAPFESSSRSAECFESAGNARFRRELQRRGTTLECCLGLGGENPDEGKPLVPKMSLKVSHRSTNGQRRTECHVITWGRTFLMLWASPFIKSDRRASGRSADPRNPSGTHPTYGCVTKASAPTTTPLRVSHVEIRMLRHESGERRSSQALNATGRNEGKPPALVGKE